MNSFNGIVNYIASLLPIVGSQLSEVQATMIAQTTAASDKANTILDKINELKQRTLDKLTDEQQEQLNMLRKQLDQAIFDINEDIKEVRAYLNGDMDMLPPDNLLSKGEQNLLTSEKLTQDQKDELQANIDKLETNVKDLLAKKDDIFVMGSGTEQFTVEQMRNIFSTKCNPTCQPIMSEGPGQLSDIVESYSNAGRLNTALPMNYGSAVTSLDALPSYNPQKGGSSKEYKRIQHEVNEYIRKQKDLLKKKAQKGGKLPELDALKIEKHMSDVLKGGAKDYSSTSSSSSSSGSSPMMGGNGEKEKAEAAKKAAKDAEDAAKKAKVAAGKEAEEEEEEEEDEDLKAEDKAEEEAEDEAEDKQNIEEEEADENDDEGADLGNKSTGPNVPEESGFDTDIKVLPFYSSSDSNYSFSHRPKLANRFD
jgi:hypothetical protein